MTKIKNYSINTPVKMKKLLLTLLFLPSVIIYAQSPCSGGTAGGFPCNGLDLQGHIRADEMGNADEGQDSWGWTDPSTGLEYAVVALDDGTAFVRLEPDANPSNPPTLNYLARLNTQTSTSLWRDVKIYNNHAYIVSDSNGSHGVQIFDLTRLRPLTGSPAVTYTKNQADGRYSGIGSAHNIIINEDTGYLYILGSSANSGAPRILDLNTDPENPTVAGNFSSTFGYCHDAQVVVYDGPDPDHQGKEILIGSFSNSGKLQIVDVSTKGTINTSRKISEVSYTKQHYTHQGWFTEDKRFFIVGDEEDEINEPGITKTRTLVFDLQDLDNPVLFYIYDGPFGAIDHNGYVRGNRFYLANYSAGMRIIRIDGLYNLDVNGNPDPVMTEINSFDTYTNNNGTGFHGAWNVYPFFESGNLIVSGFGNANVNGDGGLFVIKDPNYDNEAPVANCQNITATLDKNTGTVTVDAAMINNGSTDNFGIVKSYVTAARTTFNCYDVGSSFDIVLTVEDDYGNKDSCTATVTIAAETTTYNGSWDNGAPSIGSLAKFSSNYDTTNGNIETCECEIDATAVVTVAPDDYINVERNFVNNGTLIVESVYDVPSSRVISGSVVQVDDNAVFTNNGGVNIDVATPQMSGRDFMLMGSPMTAETRTDAFGSALRVRNHLTANFTPNTAVGNSSPGAGNWVDEEGDNWPVYNGAINPGEGYMVMQSLSGGPTSYTMTYDQGTLNNGVVTFNAIYNGTQNASPNIIANPYASAISAEDLINANSNVDAVYFWEHVTAPNSGTPGPYGLDYTMEDISVYNLTGGTAAAVSDGSTTPNGVISTGQGFGVKVTAAGPITFNNSMRRNTGNNTLRNQTDRDRIWLNVQSDRYELKSTALIGFMEEATNGIDVGYDSKRLATNVSLFSHLADGSDQLGIQARGAFDETVKIPVGFSTLVDENIEYTISVKDIEGDNLSNVIVYLIDNLENELVNLSETNYTFTSGKGIYNGRFTIQFERVLATGEESFDNIKIYPNPSSDIIHIISNDEKIISAEVYGIRGRVIDEIFFDETSGSKLDISHLETAVYFVKINTESGTVVKRVLKH